MKMIRTHTRKLSKSGAIEGEILLIEDQRSLAKMAAQMLHERWGCHVLIATTMEQVLKIIAQKKLHFFVAISDLNLPDAHHGEVIDVLIANKIPVIALTGMFDAVMHDKIINKGVVDYVLKNSINAYEYIVELVGRLHRNISTKVLVIDDSDTFCDLLTAMLKIQGLQVVRAADGMEGLKLLEQQPDIKLVLVDHEMPNMDGFKFLLHVRRRLAKDRLAVIGMAGSEDRRMSSHFLKLGANDFIAKPFSYEELACRVSQNLDMLESIEAISFVAYHDYLTGLLNRRAFFEQGSKLFDERAKAGQPPAIAVLDIDFFKKINDLYGHEGGDVVLRHFAVMLGEHFSQDMVARMGGEEFALLLTDADNAAAQCEAFRQLVAQSSVKYGNVVIAFTVSIGITRQLSSDLDERLRVADENLYKAKQNGRNRIVLT